jgi:hypothetical protein
MTDTDSEEPKDAEDLRIRLRAAVSAIEIPDGLAARIRALIRNTNSTTENEEC